MSKKDFSNNFDIKQFITTLLAVVVGGLIGFGGNAYIQAQQFSQEALGNDRQERKDIYLEFLDIANTYSNRTNDAKDCLLSLGDRDIDDIQKIVKMNSKCNEDLAELASARHEFQGYINEISIYGSEKAYYASGGIQHTLPPSVGTAADSSGVPVFEAILDYDYKSMAEAYRHFLTVACEELPSKPRSKCEL